MMRAILLFFLFFISCTKQEERKYCGPVVNKFMTGAGYKVSSKAHVVFYNDSLKRNIDVQVSWNTYANAVNGKNICFTLKDWETK